MNTILIIEDDEALKENTAELLELSNYKAITASNGKIGIDKALQDVPDLIICDIMMPEIDGYGVLESLALQDKTKHIPFIFLSAKTKHKEIRKGMNMGADDYLTKPFEEEELLGAVESRLAKANLFTEKEPEVNGEEQQENIVQNLEELRDFFIKEGDSMIFNKEDVIYNKGDHSNQLFLIRTGLVKTHVLDMNGKELITDLYKPQDFLGFTSFEGNVPFNETATAMENTKVVMLSKGYLKDILQGNQNISLEFMNLLTDSISSIKDQLMRMAYSSVRKKTASTIIRFAELTNKQSKMEIRISRNDLAANAGIAPESLIRTLSGFKKKGLIAIDGRTIKIIDLNGLKKLN